MQGPARRLCDRQYEKKPDVRAAFGAGHAVNSVFALQREVPRKRCLEMLTGHRRIQRTMVSPTVGKREEGQPRAHPPANPSRLLGVGRWENLNEH